MPLTVTTTPTTINQVYLRQLGKFLQYANTVHQRKASTQINQFAEITASIKRQLNFPHPKSDATKINQSLLIQWILAKPNEEHPYNKPVLSINSKIITASPNVIAVLFDRLKPLADRSKISLVISNQPIKSSFHQFNMIEPVLALLPNLINNLFDQEIPAQTLLYELYTSNFKSLIDGNQLSASDVLAELPLLKQTVFKPNEKGRSVYDDDRFGYNFTLIYLDQFIGQSLEITSI